LAAGFALRIDTLHGKAGHVLHFSPSVAAKPGSAEPPGGRSPWRAPTERTLLSENSDYSTRSGRAGTTDVMTRILPREGGGVKGKDYKILWYGYRGGKRD
jgi:hypothetical protein